MSKILAVKSTVFPNGKRINWESGMPKHKTFVLDTDLFNMWHRYIRRQTSKDWSLNKVKQGGLNHAEAQEKVLEMYKLMLK